MPFLCHVINMYGVHLDKPKVEVMQYQAEQHKIQNYSASWGLKLVEACMRNFSTVSSPLTTHLDVSDGQRFQLSTY